MKPNDQEEDVFAPVDVEEGTPDPPPPAKNKSPAVIAAIVISYFTISMSLVFVNKMLMKEDFFPFPTFMTWFQFIVATIALTTLGYLGSTSVPALSFLPTAEFDPKIAKSVAPVTIIFVCMIVFNNFCLKYVEVSFYQVARSLTIVFTIIFTYIFLNKTTSKLTICACGIVIVGFALGTKGEINFSVKGVAFGLISSVFVSLYGIVVQRALAILNGDHWRLAVYNNILSVVFLLPIVIFNGEFSQYMEFTSAYSTTQIWTLNLVAGLLGFSVNIVIFLQISYTSALTNNISGTVKAALQTVLAVIIFKNPISFLNAVGIMLVIGGSAFYSALRYLKI